LFSNILPIIKSFIKIEREKGIFFEKNGEKYLFENLIIEIFKEIVYLQEKNFIRAQI